MKTYLVGGAVRDGLMGHPAKDRDYVVVGGTVDAMLAAGFLQVGADFPVFLHPETKEEYALARTERKSGHGHTGFVVHAAPSVTLEADLGRRDLTINAMARTPDGRIIDPYGGRADLVAKVLRHVSEAFAEDPLRIFRLARFAARYPEFVVAPETMTLARQMVAAGELEHLAPERIWAEIQRGLMATKPSRLIEVLRECGALAAVLPEVDRLFAVPQPPAHHPEGDAGRHTLLVIDRAAHHQAPLAVRFACLLHDVGKGVTDPAKWPAHHDHEEQGLPLVEAICQRLRVSAECRAMAAAVATQHLRVHRSTVMRPGSLVQLLERLDTFRRPERLTDVLLACQCDHEGRGIAVTPYAPAALLPKVLAAARAVRGGEIAKNAKPAQIPALIFEARARAAKECLASH